MGSPEGLRYEMAVGSPEGLRYEMAVGSPEGLRDEILRRRGKCSAGLQACR
jgi:hypothetical protein